MNGETKTVGTENGNNNVNPARERINPPHFDAVMAGVERYSSEDKERVLWLYGYFSGCLRQNKALLCREIGWKEEEWDQLAPLFTGRIAAGIRDDVFAAIDALKRRLAKQKPLVHTVSTDMIIAGLDYCRDNSAMVYIKGSTGRGKTYTAEWWAQENNHGRTKLLRAPSECGRKALLQMLARSFGVSAAGSNSELIANLGKAITPRNVIIIDEAGHLLNKSGKAGGAIDVLRDIYDMYHCGICLIFTDVFLAELTRGKNADYFEQFIGRFEWPVELPTLVRRDEVRQILTAFLGDAADEDTVNFALTASRERDGKLRTLFKDLFRAEEIAKAANRAMTPRDFKIAVSWRKKAGVWPEDK